MVNMVKEKMVELWFLFFFGLNVEVVLDNILFVMVFLEEVVLILIEVILLVILVIFIFL